MTSVWLIVQRISPIVLGCTAGFSIFAAEPTAEQFDFFEKKVRPILAEHCYSCHSAKSEKLKGGLGLDTKAAMLRGGDTGPAVVAGDLDKSLLIKAVRYTDENLRMPPRHDGADKKLPAEVIADLEAWVKMGAPDPRVDALAGARSPAAASNHWAFKAISRPSIPAVKNPRWVQTPVDAFVLARLEASRLFPATQADKRTLIRRVTFDLTGLPPTPEEVSAFIADHSPGAFAKVVDRLLATPRYGERWGRHWLDVARYADTKGYVGGEEIRYAYSYTYRDYVVRAFNEDLPFDRFITQQLAADRLPLGEDNRPLAALGFLTLGRRFINNETDIIDDRLDVICRGLMGVTIQCARCHDHKYDPVPTRDYYSLYGVMKSSMEPTEKPLLAKQPKHPQYDDFLAEKAKRQAAVDDCTHTNTVDTQAKFRYQVDEYLMLAHDTAKLTNEVEREKILRDRKLNKFLRDRWTTQLTAAMKTNDAIFTPLFAFNALTNSTEFPAKAKELAAKFAANNDPTNKLNPLVAQLFAGEPPAAMTNVVERYGRLLRRAHDQWQALLVLNGLVPPPPGSTNALPFTALPDPDMEAVRQVQYAADAAANPPATQYYDTFLFDDAARNRIDELKRNLASVDVTHAGAPPRAMSMEDRPKPEEVRVFIRGNPGTPGTNAPRRFIEVASRGERALFPTNSSGRLELAQAIVSRDNPLTARVFVNRVWLQHFGAGLVRTPSDFGVRAEAPSHLELLDWLATWFMDNGWSVKKLHRLILLSSVYQQSTLNESPGAMLDADNRLLSRQNRRRLDFEAMRDSLLAVSRQLEESAGGQPVDIVGNPLNRRRTIYGLVDRQDLPNLFRVFDFANPDTSSPQRFQTTVAAQALFLMNSPMVIERAKNLVALPAFQGLRDNDARAQFLYENILQREPSRAEIRMVCEFSTAPAVTETVNPEASAWQYGEGRYDEVTQHVIDFTAFTNFNNGQWQVSEKFPDPKRGYLMLNADGGHTAEGGITHAAIRRWTAPRAGRVQIRGELTHGSADGDGVRSRIVSSRAGELNVWVAHNNKADTSVALLEVRAGDTVDFVTDCGANTSSDTFKWPTVIAWMDGAPMGEPVVWDTQKNFMDVRKLPRPLAAWEKFAQILLLSNEFSFVD